MTTQRRDQLIIFCLFFITPILYALITQHAWEDWYITYRSSKNLAIGNGLVFRPGERLHTFTSPLGTLLPAFLTWITGNYSDDLVLWLYRICNSILLGLSGVLLYRFGKQVLRHSLPLVLLLGLVLFDSKLIDNSINGMETALMIFFLTFCLYVMTGGTRRLVLPLALGFAGLMWSRPDGFIHVSGLSIGLLIWAPANGTVRTRADWFQVLVKAALLGLLFYLPWILWAWWYYGTPVPNTVLAKGLNSTTDIKALLKTLVLFPYVSLTDPAVRLYQVYAPSYSFMGGWPAWVATVSKLLGWIACFYWIVPGAKKWGRIISFGALISCLYLSLIKSNYPWYIPMATLLCSGSLVILFDQLIERFRLTVARQITYGLMLIVVLFQIGLLGAMAYQMRVQQATIENNRQQVGLWLKSQAGSPKETVFLECLGYIGFYSGLTMYDFPGLSSSEVVNARRQIGAMDYPFVFAPLIEQLKPDWVVLRPYEHGVISTKSQVLSQEYEMVREFSVWDKVESMDVPGKSYMEWDAVFRVFRRKKEGTTLSQQPKSNELTTSL
ncbi:hypothetical protein GCM10023187_38000 [Nibrella viscosa]|uniref:Glycosyltransferase RgtA/B/C/D-like domain-containing protein n=1 Tax=Nibrella viscosa TaxID=1084524 RepID=A0ABP8KNF7_9BACT